MSSAPAGWYDDGQTPGRKRWWNGTVWTDDYDPPVETVTDVPEPAHVQHKAEPSAGATTEDDAKVTMFNAKKVVAELRAKVAEQDKAIREFGIADTVERQRRIDSLIADISAGEERLRVLSAELATVQSSLVNVRDVAHLQEYGLYDFEHPAETSADLAIELELLRKQIKELNKADRAISATTAFTYNNSAAKGRSMVKDFSRLALRAYNAEAENCTKSVKAGNLPSAITRLGKAADQIASTGKFLDIRITHEYHQARLKELELASRHMQVLAAEREAERERKAELREQAKVEAELRKERERLEKEKAHYLNSIAALQAKGDSEGAARLQEKLADVDKAIDDVDYRAANIRAGYVYVISNLGAFGENMVKIGMTRRLEPMERVKELGDASVPFRFDVHALFFAHDAVEVEAMLHREFAPQRVNKVNLRREFFNVTPEQVLEVLKAHDVEVIEYDTHQVADEYRTSWPSPSTAEPVFVIDRARRR